MKPKVLKKAVSAIAAFSVIAAALSPMAVLAAEGDPVGGDTVMIEFEDCVNSANADAGFTAEAEWAQISTKPANADDRREFTVTFDAAAAGYYYFDITAACYGSAEWLSNVLYSINGSGEKDLYTSGDYRLLQPLDAAGVTFRRGLFAMKEPVYLNEGTNTLTLRCGARTMNSGDLIVAALDKAVFMPKNVIPSNGRIELENYAVDNGIESLWQATASNSQIAYINDKENMGEDEFELTVNVEETGSYSLGLATGCRQYLVWLSPLSISVNGGAYESLDGYLRTDYSGDTTTYGTALFTRPEPITLNAGENTIKIKATQRDDGGIIYSLDYLDIKPVGVTKDLPESGRIEGEGYATEWGTEITAQATSSGGMSAVKKAPGETSDEISIKINVPEEGDYVAALGAGCAAWASWLSPIEISFNEGGYEDTAHTDKYAVSGVISVSDDGFRAARITRQQTVHLNEGENTIKLRMRERADGGIYYSIDYIDLVRVQNVENIAPLPESGRIETEDYAEQVGMEKYDLDVESGGATSRVANADMTSDVVSFAFTSDEEKTVMLQIGAAAKAWAPWLSPVYVSLNGGEKEDLLSFNRIATHEGDDGFRSADMVRNGAVKINKGLNVITFYAEERDASYNGGIYYGIDYIDFTKAYDELTAPQMYLNQEMNVGDTISAIIMDGSKIVTPDTVYQLTFKSDNEEVASVDGSGLVKGVSAGTATITAAIRANRASEEIVLKQTVTVNGDTTELASVKNVKNDNGKISFDVTSSFGIDTAQAYVASYDNGVLVSVKLQEISVGANGSVTVEKTLDNYDSSQNVKIFVWLDQYPLTGCVEVQ